MFYKNRGQWTDIRRYIFDCCERNKDYAYCVYKERSEKRGFTYGQMLDSIKRLGSYLSQRFSQGSHISLLGKTSVAWVSAYYSSLSYGIVVSPLDIYQTDEELCRQFEFTDSVALLYDASFKKTAELIAQRCPGTVCIPFYPGASDGDISVFGLMNGDGPVIEPPQLAEDSLCEIMFTSGTTGVGKGVMTSNGNIISTIMMAVRLVDFSSGDRVLSILPNNHTYQLVVGLLAPMYFGASVVVNCSRKNFKKCITDFRPTVILGVPAMLSLFRKEIMRGISAKGAEKKFERSVKLTRFFRHIGIDLRSKAFGEIIDYFGGRLSTLICGGAFLADDLIEFYTDIGVSVIQGYGITECSPIVSCNTDRKTRALGEISPYCRVKCIDGEICVQGKNVMLGYYKDPEATARVIIDGWFHTGDLGSVDKHNCLQLEGRKDNLIINSNGENISPEYIENILCCADIISDCLVYGEDDLIAVSVYPNYRYAEENGIKDVEKAVRDVVTETNGKLPVKMHVERVSVRSEPFDLTTTMKIKRYKHNKH